MGLLIIGFVMLVVGLFGVDFYMNEGVVEYLTFESVFAVALLGGLVLAIASIYAYKANSNFGTCTFGWVAFSLFILAAAGGAFGGLFDIGFDPAGAWTIWIIITIFYFVFVIWAFLAGAPKLLVAVLAVAALVFLFLGLAMNNGPVAEDMKNMLLAMGIFGIIDFVLATYLGLALTEEVSKLGKLKVF
ncbi:MAG: hypothetical protein GX224_06095 [Thermoplasmatales archaeon]|nr:hypothetical protein [Thermoplasmatales archaeon]